MKKINYTKKPEINYGLNFNYDLIRLFQRHKFSNKKIILITGLTSFKKTKYYGNLKKILTEFEIDILHEISVDKNPTWDKINKTKHIVANTDIIMCIGGGSVIDFGKAIKLHSNKNSKIFVIYTIPGSASIVTPFTIFNNKEFKIGEHSEKILPDYVYINKNILKKIPVNLLQIGMFDILTHITESYMSKISTRKSRLYAIKALRFLNLYIEGNQTNYLPLVKSDILAGLSERTSLVLFPHAIGHYLTFKNKIAHGLATMYFFNKFLYLILSKGAIIPNEILILVKKFNIIFQKKYKTNLFFSKKEINKSYKLIDKYMPFTFKNSPVILGKVDYLILYKEYEK